MPDIRDEIIKLGDNLARERNEAFDLWTWLPSYKAARAYHGDYACELMPSVKDIMHEASLFIGHGCNPNKQEIELAIDYYCCPCDDSVEHSPVILPSDEKF